VLWLDKGEVKGYGDPKETIQAYQRFMKVTEEDESSEEDV
jgi:ABC-type polysaccharide/polyol phosphate transport system ATPase subunit